MRLIFLILSLVVVLAISFLPVFAEDFKITTYYPSPYGAYSTLEVSSSFILRTDATTPSTNAPDIQWRTSTTASNMHWNIDQFRTGGDSYLRFITERNDESAAGTVRVTFYESGAILINDGNQDMGKVLTSDADGVGTWQTFKTFECIRVNVPAGQNGNSVCASAGGYQCTSAYAGDPYMCLTNFGGGGGNARCCRIR